MNKSLFYKIRRLFKFSFVLYLCISASALQAQNARVTLSLKNVPLERAMSALKEQSQCLFVNKDVDVRQTVSVEVRNVSLNEALNKLFVPINVRYIVEGTNIIISRNPVAKNQPVAVSGKVIDSKGAPVIGAAVLVKGTTVGASTGADGSFSLQVPPPSENQVLTVNFLGYDSQEIPVGTRTGFRIELKESALDLEAVVVTALGIKRQERAVSYNVQNVSTDVFQAKEANLVNSLAGKIAGVTINSSAAGVGGETKVVMRGSKSIAGSNNALYVLDGIPLPTLSMSTPSASYSIMRDGGVSGDGIAMLNSDDIGNMSVLTGPSSAALYGSKAANGVVMLSTQTGEKGISVSYSNNTTFMSPFRLPEFQNTYGSKTGAYSSWGTKLSSAQSWSPEDFFQTGYNTTNSVGLSFGGEHSSTYLSASVVKAEGIIPNNDFNRYNFTVNHTNSFLNDKMHLSVLGMYINSNEQNMLAAGQYYNPMVPIYLFSPGDDINKYSVYERYNPSRKFKTQYWDWGSQDMQMQNPYWIINRNMFNTAKDRFLLGASLKYDLTDYLSLTGRARVDYTGMTAEQRNYASTSGLFAGDNGRYYDNEYKTVQKYGDLMLNFNKSFFDNQFSLTAAVGASIEDSKYRATLIGGDLGATANLFTLANMTANRSFAKENYNDQTQSIFATVQMGFRNMVFLDVTGRNDWCTGLYNTGSLSMFYPSVGLSAVLTDIFGVKSKVLSFAKIRASYAEVGNAPMRYITVPTYPVTVAGPQTTTYMLADSYEPERTKSWEIGADVRLWGNKVNLSATYYSSRTFNQLFNPEITSTSNASSIYVNAGRVDNHGIEVSAELNQKLGQVDWTSNIVYSRNRNKVKEMLRNYSVNGQIIRQDSMVMGGTTGVKMVLHEGGTMSDIYVNTLKTDEHGMIWVSPTGGTVAAAANNWVYAGTNNPSYNLSWRNSFSWKNFTLGFMFNARVGGVGVSLTQAAMDGFGVSERSADARNNGGALVNGQRIDAENYYMTIGGNGANAIGAYYVYSMTNVRLGELTLGYDLPVQKWCKWIKGINVSFVGRNLCMLYCKAPFDPESVSGTGTYSSAIEYFQQPSLRNIGFSVKLTF